MRAEEGNFRVLELDTPTGGKVMFGVGTITTSPDDKEPQQACMTKITDPNGKVIAEYALIASTFGTYMEAVNRVFNLCFPCDLDAK